MLTRIGPSTTRPNGAVRPIINSSPPNTCRTPAQSLALHTTLNMLASEMAVSAPGSELVVNRLADMLFIHSIRAHIGSRSEACKNGLLRAIFDPQIGVALKAMHEKVERPWTVESLAAACGMSRSAFAVHFKNLVGETPLEYLTSWRMQKATGLLQKGDKKLFEVAKSVGYDSDAAFSKAFKRMFGGCTQAVSTKCHSAILELTWHKLIALKFSTEIEGPVVS